MILHVRFGIRTKVAIGVGIRIHIWPTHTTFGAIPRSIPTPIPTPSVAPIGPVVHGRPAPGSTDGVNY